MILLDTDVCVEILRHNPRILARFRAVQQEARIPFMTAAELLYGAEKSDDPDRNREQVEELLGSVDIVESDEKSISPAERKRRREKLESLFGSWVDSRSTEEIIADIVGSRTMGREVNL